MLRKLANIGLVIFLMVSGLFIVLYVFAFFDKILHPQYKNLSMAGYGWLGLIVIVFLIADYFIIKRFIGGSKGTSSVRGTDDES